MGREETLGMVAAVEAWVKRDHAAEWKKWLGYLDTIAKRVSQVSGVKTSVNEPTGPSNKSPSLAISWEADQLHITGEEVAEDCARKSPRIALGAGVGAGGSLNRGAMPVPSNTTGVTITAWMMRPGDDQVVAERLHALLAQKRSPKPAPAAPAGNIARRWDVTVEFFSSSSQHAIALEQDASGKLQGSHTGDFSVRDIFGVIEGNKVKLQSMDRGTADFITFTFDGTLSNGDTISGHPHGRISHGEVHRAAARLSVAIPRDPRARRPAAGELIGSLPQLRWPPDSTVAGSSSNPPGITDTVAGADCTTRRPDTVTQ